MTIELLKSKIHRATITDSNLNYIGSITIDADLMEAANLLEYEKVTVVNNNNGQRFDTYVIRGNKGSGDICVNGSAARLVHRGDTVIIMAYAQLTPEEAKTFKPRVVFPTDDNKLITR